MKLLIHGRKNGYSVLYPSPNTPSEFYKFASDIQSISATNNGIYYGKNIYTIAFTDGGNIFTIYIFGDDVERGQLGEIGISVFIPNTQKLAGSEVKSLLDELVKLYSINYIDNNRIVEPQNGFDWLLFTSKADSYDIKLVSRSSKDDSVEIGTFDPAFHYYKSDSELIEHFDKPFQEEYSPYKQILFIDNNLQGVANPLNVLKNSGVEVKPDLTNENYYLNNYSSSKGIRITTNGKQRSDGKNNNVIRAKWQVEINYSKDDRCYEPIKAQGTIADLTSDIHKYLEIKGNQIFLNYDAFNNPIQKIKPVTFEIKDRNGEDVEGPELFYKSDYQNELKAIGNTIPFKGEDIIKNWTVIAHKGNNFDSDEITIIPEKQDTVIIKMYEVKKIEVDATNENGIVYDFTVRISAYGVNKQTSSLEFRDERIDQECTIEITKTEGRDYYSGTTVFTPKNQSRIHIVLTRKKSTKQVFYSLDMGVHGSASAGFSNKEDGSDISVKINTEGYVFKTFKLDSNNKQNNSEGTLIAQYEETKSFVQKTKNVFSKPAVFASSVIAILVLVLCIWALSHILGDGKATKETTITSTRITVYVEGDSLMFEKLNEYKTKWQSQEQDYIQKSGGGFFGGKERKDSTKWKTEWKPAMESIELAITKRELIINKQFDELKKQNFNYQKQSVFKMSIEKIDSTKWQQLGDLSSLTLTQIAEKINSGITPKEPIKGEKINKQKKEVKKVEPKIEKTGDQPKKQLKQLEQKNTQTQPVVTDNTSEIIAYIKGSELKKEKLNQYLKVVGKNEKLKESIKLCLKLWDLDGTKNKSYLSYKKELENNNNFKDSDLKIFIDDMCEIEQPKYIKYLPSIDQNRSLSKIKEIVK